MRANSSNLCISDSASTVGNASRPNESIARCARVQREHNLLCVLELQSVHCSRRRIDSDEGRAYELSHSAIKCMRSVLLAWMTLTERVCNMHYSPNSYVVRFRVRYAPRCTLILRTRALQVPYFCALLESFTNGDEHRASRSSPAASAAASCRPVRGARASGAARRRGAVL